MTIDNDIDRIHANSVLGKENELDTILWKLNDNKISLIYTFFVGAFYNRKKRYSHIEFKDFQSLKKFSEELQVQIKEMEELGAC